MVEEINLSQEELRNLKEKYEKLFVEAPSSPAFVFLAEILIKLGETERAADVLIQGLRHNPENVTARFILGKIYYDKRMVDQAKREMEEVIKSAPDNVAASKILLETHRIENEFDKALEVANSVSIFFPGDDEIRDIIEELKKEIAHAGEKERDEFLESASEGYDEGSFPGLLKGEIYTETMADLYMNQKLYEEAVKVFEKLIERDQVNHSLRRKLERAKAYLLSEKAGLTIKK